MRESRIKEYRFSNTINATTTGSFVSDHSLNGEVLEVSWIYGSQGATGSLSLSFGETQEIFWKRNTASGVGIQTARPYVISEISTGSGANAGLVPYVCNDKIILNCGSILSGTTPVNCIIRYR